MGLPGGEVRVSHKPPALATAPERSRRQRWDGAITGTQGDRCAKNNQWIKQLIAQGKLHLSTGLLYRSCG
jgi:hypothetical protein